MFLKNAFKIAATLLILVGIMLFLFCLALNDPEIEGESGRISLGTYFISLIPIIIGILFFIVSSKIKKKKSD